MICSLRAQIELADYNPQLNYGAVLQHCLPPRILPFISTEVVALHHQSLFGMTPQEAKQAFFNIIQSWPLHRATFYDVTVKFCPIALLSYSDNFFICIPNLYSSRLNYNNTRLIIIYANLIVVIFLGLHS